MACIFRKMPYVFLSINKLHFSLRRNITFPIVKINTAYIAVPNYVHRFTGYGRQIILYTEPLRVYVCGTMA